MNEPEAPENHRTRVFISYSRVDGVFAEKLRNALIARGFEAYLDREDILPGEPWRARIEALILAADAIVFVMSPSSIASEVCCWEVARALELKKSLTPLHWCIVPNDAVPMGLSERNYVFFDTYERSGMADEAAFQASLSKLETALLVTDILWVREHTKWVARAVEWDQAEPARPEGKLLRATDIAVVQGWSRLKPASAPAIPSVLTDYLAASIAKEDEDTKRLRRTTGRAFVPYARQAFADGFNERTIRAAAAGALLADDLDFALIPELWRAAAPAVIQNRTRAVLKGHSDVVRVVAFSPDGERVLTASDDRTARIWDAATGREIARLEPHSSKLKSASFSPDGKWIVTASNNARVWEAESGKELVALTHDLYVDAPRPDGSRGPVLLTPDMNVEAATFSPDGKRVLTACDNTARIWDIASGTEVALLEHPSTVTFTAFSPSGRRVVTICGLARVWEAESEARIADLDDEAEMNSAEFSADDNRLLTASDDHKARVWDIATEEEIAVFEGHEAEVKSARFSPGGTRVLTASEDHTARVWDAVSGEEIAVLQHDQALWSARFSQDGKRVITASCDRTARVWEAESGRQLALLNGHEDAVTDAVFSIDGKRALTASLDWTTRIWDTASSQETVRIPASEGDATTALSPDGKHMVTTHEDFAARIWDAESGNELAVMKGHADYVNSATFSQDGTRLVTASQDHTVRLWDTKGGKEVALLSHQQPVSEAAFSPDGRNVLTACGKTAQIWDAESGKEIALLQGHTQNIKSARFSPDGQRVLTVCSATARIWEIARAKEIVALTNPGRDWGAAFSPDGARVSTGSDDKTAQIWDAESGQQLLTLKGHEGRVTSAVFSPDGKRIVTASDDHTARIWDAQSGKELVILKVKEETESRARLSSLVALLDIPGKMTSAVFSPDGTRIATASDDRTARIWDAESGAALMVLAIHEEDVLPYAGGVRRVAFSPDGKRLLTSSADHSVRVWDIARTDVPLRQRAVVLAAALARGVGWRTAPEGKDLLMQDAPQDMFAAAVAKLDGRESEANDMAALLDAPLHPNCYLIPAEFAAKFGLSAVAATKEVGVQRPESAVSRPLRSFLDD